MYKILTVATLLVGLALAPFLGSVEFGPHGPMAGGSRGTVERAGSVESPRQAKADAAQVDAIAACSWSCQACEPDQGCSQICTEIGECGSVCGVMARCDAGFRWDEDACTCVTR